MDLRRMIISMMTTFALLFSVAYAQEGTEVIYIETEEADVEIDAERPEVMFGFKAGVNMSSVDGDVTGIGLKTAGQAGIYGVGMVTDRIGIQSELLYSLEGAESSVDERDGRELNLHYINLPLLAKFYATDGLYLTTGPQLGFLVNANDFGVNLTERRLNGEDDVTDDFHRLAGAWEVGLGYQFASGFDIDLRYNIGFTNIVEHPISGDPRVRNQSYQLSVGYLFD